jgi:hypothetical protein
MEKTNHHSSVFFLFGFFAVLFVLTTVWYLLIHWLGKWSGQLGIVTVLCVTSGITIVGLLVRNWLDI